MTLELRQYSATKIGQHWTAEDHEFLLIALADTAVRALTPEEASHAAELLLARVGRDQLRTLSTERLLAAVTDGPDLSLRFTPVVDGRTLPQHPYDPAAPQVSSDIPIMPS